MASLSYVRNPATVSPLVTMNVAIVKNLSLCSKRGRPWSKKLCLYPHHPPCLSSKYLCFLPFRRGSKSQGIFWCVCQARMPDTHYLCPQSLSLKPKSTAWSPGLSVRKNLKDLVCGYFWLCFDFICCREKVPCFLWMAPWWIAYPNAISLNCIIRIPLHGIWSRALCLTTEIDF